MGLYLSQQDSRTYYNSNEYTVLIVLDDTVSLYEAYFVPPRSLIDVTLQYTGIRTIVGSATYIYWYILSKHDEIILPSLFGDMPRSFTAGVAACSSGHTCTVLRQHLPPPSNQLSTVSAVFLPCATFGAKAASIAVYTMAMVHSPESRQEVQVSSILLTCPLHTNCGCGKREAPMN